MTRNLTGIFGNSRKNIKIYISRFAILIWIVDSPNWKFVFLLFFLFSFYVTRSCDKTAEIAAIRICVTLVITNRTGAASLKAACAIFPPPWWRFRHAPAVPLSRGTSFTEKKYIWNGSDREERSRDRGATRMQRVRERVCERRIE